jgi:hypothetical protein
MTSPKNDNITTCTLDHFQKKMAELSKDNLSKEDERLKNMQIGMRPGLGFGLLLLILAVVLIMFIAQ